MAHLFVKVLRLVPSTYRVMLLPERHRVHRVEHRGAPDQLVVELVVARGRRQERVPVGHEEVENDHNLGMTVAYCNELLYREPGKGL